MVATQRQASAELAGVDGTMQKRLFDPQRLAEFLEFYKNNPHVYLMFAKLANQLLDAGKTRIGGRLIWERIRWELFLDMSTDDVPRLNDHHVPYMVRLLTERQPRRFRGRFVTKDKRFDCDASELRKRCDEIDAERTQQRLKEGAVA